MQLLEIKEHASEFNIGDHVVVSNDVSAKSNGLLAIGYICAIGFDFVRVGSGDANRNYLEKVCEERWSYAAKASSELSAQLDDLLKTAQETTDKSEEAPNADAEIGVFTSSSPSRPRSITERVIAIIHIYPTYDLALDAAATQAAIPGHLFSSHEQNSLEVTSFYKHNDTHTCRWGGTLPNNCSFVYVTRYPAGKNV